MKRILFTTSVLLVCFSYAELRPVDYDKRICHVVNSNWGWARSINYTAKRYNVSPGLLLAVIYHESGFQQRARPKPVKLLGFIPWQASTAYGYGQIKNETWEWYKENNPGWFQSRTSFSDTLDFIGWYYQLFLKKSNSNYVHRDFYLAYHEGLGGYENGSYQNNQWLINRANEVALRAEIYDEALRSCL